MNPNLPRWCFASLAKHFAGVADSINLNYHVQGVDEAEIGDFQDDSALFIMDGPIARTGSKDYEWYTLDLCIVLTDIVKTTGDRAYAIYEWGGVFQASMLNDRLQIFKYGDGPEDDGSLIGCLELDKSLRNNVWLHNYGQVDKDLRVKQASANGRFILCI